MLEKLIEKEAAAVKHAVHAVREWIHPTKVMKAHAFDRPLAGGRSFPERAQMMPRRMALAIAIGRLSAPSLWMACLI